MPLFMVPRPAKLCWKGKNYVRNLVKVRKVVDIPPRHVEMELDRDLLLRPLEKSAVLTRSILNIDTSYGTTSSDAEQSDAMKKVKKEFSKSHAMAIHLNFIGMVATIGYGVGLASKIRFVP